MKQRIKLFTRESRTIPDLEAFDLETETQIEEKFQQFMEDAKNDYIQLSKTPKHNVRRMAYNRKLTIKQSQQIDAKSQEASETYTKDEVVEEIPMHVKSELRLEQAKQAEFYKFFSERYFRKEEKNSQAQKAYSTDVSFLVQRYGDFLQNSLLSSLIVETIREKFVSSSIPMYDHFGTAKKILQQFNISPVSLVNLKTAQERQDYLIKQFEGKVHSLMKDWEVKIAQKDKRLQEIDLQFSLAQKKENQQKNDLFYWLILRTKFTTLQKKLREMLMEKINEYENNLKLIDAIKDNKVISLLGMPISTTAEIVNRSDPQIKDYKIRKTQSIYDDQQFEWNQFLEKKFIKERQRSIKAYNAAIKSSNLNQVAFMQIFDELKIEDPIHLQRDLKLAKYMNGDWLTPQEMKFIANTSILLNQCVDKKYIMKAVKHIEQDQLQNIETYLAEQIINNHKMMKSKIEKARSQWIKQQIKITKNKIQSKDQISYHKSQIQQNIKLNEQRKKTLKRICDKMEKEISIKDQVYRNFYCQIFVRKVLIKVDLIRMIKQEEILKYNEDYFKEQERIRQHKQRLQELSKITNNFEKSQELKRKLHPPSKVGLLPITMIDLDTIEGKLLQTRKELMKQKEKEYKLKILASDNNKKENFIKFYSNGPKKGLRQVPFYDPLNPKAEPNINNKEMESIIKIQKAIRKYLCGKKLRNYKDVFYQKKYKSYFNRLQDMNSQKKFQDSVKNVSIQLINKPNLNQNQKRVRSEISLSSLKMKRSIMKTEETAEPSLGFSRQQRLLTSQNGITVKNYQIKHERLLRYSKLNQANQIIKSGFYYGIEDIDVIDIDGNTALFYAAMHGNNSLTEYLLRCGANPNILCNQDTPMHMAVKSERVDVIYYFYYYYQIVFMLLNYKGSMEILNKLNQTPLVYATNQMLKQLGMSQGAVSVRDKEQYLKL